MSALVIEEVRSKKQLDDFLRMPWKIYEGDANWVPPFLEQQRRTIDPKVNPFFEHAEMTFWLARRGAEVVGRIAGIVDHDHLTTHAEQTGFFGFFECINDTDVANALFAEATAWLSKKGMASMRGPVSPSLNYECGVLVEGYDEMPRVMMAYGPPYYEKLLEQAGFQANEELLALWYPLQQKPPLSIKELRQNTCDKLGIQVETVRYDKESIEAMRQLYNACWEANAGYVPVGETEFMFLYKEMKALLLPEFSLMASVQGKPVGFAVAIPDVNPFFAKTDGTLSLFGKLKFLFQIKKMSALRIILLGVDENYRRHGLSSLLFFELVERATKAGYQGLESSWILAGNPIVQPLLAAGNHISRRYRLYERKHEQYSQANKPIFANS